MTFQDKIKKAAVLAKDYLERYPKHGVALSFGKDSMVLTHVIR